MGNVMAQQKDSTQVLEGKLQRTELEDFKWFKEEYFKKENWVRPTVSRKNHSNNYTLDNIELQECSENSKERVKRLGKLTKLINKNADKLHFTQCHHLPPYLLMKLLP
jgi:hypothetical protein